MSLPLCQKGHGNVTFDPPPSERVADALSAVRPEGAWIGWLRFFLDGVCEIALDATRTARGLHARVNEDREALLSTRGATVTALQLFELLPGHPVISMPRVTRLLSTTKPTAGKSIDALVSAGILAEAGDRKRDRLYRYQNYLRLLE